MRQRHVDDDDDDIYGDLQPARQEHAEILPNIAFNGDTLVMRISITRELFSAVISLAIICRNHDRHEQHEDDDIDQ